MYIVYVCIYQKDIIKFVLIYLKIKFLHDEETNSFKIALNDHSDKGQV